MYEYNGKTVQIEVWARGSRWDWAYRIDGGNRRTNAEETAPTRGAAEDKAIDAARRDIDGVDESYDDEPDPEDGFAHNL